MNEKIAIENKEVSELVIQDKLNELFEARSQQQELIDIKQEAKNALITPDILVQMNIIDDHYGDQITSISNVVGMLEYEIKELILSMGMTVNGDNLQAVFVKGRVTWDSKKLMGYAEAHPEINNFKKVGKPTAQIRTIKK